MGWIIFNNKRCDNATDCPVLYECQKETDSPLKAVYFEEATQSIKLDAQRCNLDNCKTKICTKICPDCFSFANTENEYWWAIEKVRQTDWLNFKVDRYNSEGTTPFAKIEPKKCKEIVASSKGLFILEITSVVGCCSAYDSIPIPEIIPEILYQRYYKKTVVYNEADIEALESYFEINELPALLFYYDGKMIGKIMGIYRSCEPLSKILLRKKILSILQPYYNENFGNWI